MRSVERGQKGSQHRSTLSATKHSTVRLRVRRAAQFFQPSLNAVPQVRAKRHINPCSSWTAGALGKVNENFVDRLFGNRFNNLGRHGCGKRGYAILKRTTLL
jgi:hypothetical protein